MPQIQTFDFQDPRAELYGQVGQKWSDAFNQRYQQNQEADALQNILQQYKPGMDQNDLLQRVLSSPGVPIEKKNALFQMLAQQEEANRQRGLEAQTLQQKRLGSAAAARAGGLEDENLQYLEPAQVVSLAKENLKQRGKSVGLEDQWNLIRPQLEEKGYQNLPEKLPPGADQKTIDNIVKASEPLPFEKEIDKLNAKNAIDYEQRVLNSYEKALNNDAILNRMEDLVDKGDLSNPLVVGYLEHLGIPLSILNNPDTEEFNKLSETLTLGISEFFPGRILASEIQAFLRTIPRLINSDAGKKRIIENMKMLKRPQALRFEAYEDLKEKYISEGKAWPPLDLQYQLNKKIKPELQKIGKQVTEFKKEFDTVEMIKDGKVFDIPRGQLEQARKQGYKTK